MAKHALNYWSKDLHILVGRRQCWDFGPFLLSISHLRHEWQVCYQYLDMAIEDEPKHIVSYCETLEPGHTVHGELKRFYYRQATNPLWIIPTLPDRPVVVKTPDPIQLLPEQSVNLYVSLALWLRLEINNEHPQQPNPVLCELPLRELSDTWFGSSVTQGELCYSSRSPALNDRSLLKRSCGRGIVPVTITNQNSGILEINKFSIPIPNLSLYRSERGDLWSSSIHLTQPLNSDDIKLSIEPLDTTETDENRWLEISPPKQPIKEGLLTKTVTSIFSSHSRLFNN